MVLDFSVLSRIRFGPSVVVADMRLMVVVKKRGHYIIQPQRQVSVLTLEERGKNSIQRCQRHRNVRSILLASEFMAREIRRRNSLS